MSTAPQRMRGGVLILVKVVNLFGAHGQDAIYAYLLN
jgi:hypothetical protein